MIIIAEAHQILTLEPFDILAGIVTSIQRLRIVNLKAAGR
jgi:hypothetical protein